MTNQEAFDKVWHHFVTKRRVRSVNHQDNCMYRGRGGSKCAIGVLIPDEQYSKDLEDRPLSEVVPLVPALQEFNRVFLDALQVAHDYADDREEIRQNLIETANSFGLRVPSR